MGARQCASPWETFGLANLHPEGVDWGILPPVFARGAPIGMIGAENGTDGGNKRFCEKRFANTGAPGIVAGPRRLQSGLTADSS